MSRNESSHEIGYAFDDSRRAWSSLHLANLAHDLGDMYSLPLRLRISGVALATICDEKAQNRRPREKFLFYSLQCTQCDAL